MDNKRKKLFKMGLIVAFMGFGLFAALLFAENSIFEPGVFLEASMKFGFLTGILGMAIIVLGLLTFLPGAFRFANNHRTIGKGYLWLLFLATGGLLAIVFYVIKLFSNTAASIADVDKTSDPFDSPWSKSVGNTYDVGSYEWWRSR